MTAKEYLMQIRDIRFDIKLRKKELATVKETTGLESEKARKLKEKLNQEIEEFWESGVERNKEFSLCQTTNTRRF